MNNVAVIAAVAKNGVIGRDNGLPWRLSADLKWFKKITVGNSIIMGRKTWESIGKPLPQRESIVLTRQQDAHIEGCLTAQNLTQAVKMARGPQVFVIGGAEIYRQALPIASYLYLTVVHAEVNGDTWLPFIDLENWELRTSLWQEADDRNEYCCEFRIYQRSG